MFVVNERKFVMPKRAKEFARRAYLKSKTRQVIWWENCHGRAPAGAADENGTVIWDCIDEVPEWAQPYFQI